MGQAHLFKATFVSSDTDLAVPSVSQFLSKVRSSPSWDETAIVPEDGDFPRMHVSWLGNSGFTIHCFEDEASAGREPAPFREKRCGLVVTQLNISETA